ncbi:MAG: hypothetical protein ACREUT_11355 [Steroidobacteraceae bacterium]
MGLLYAQFFIVHTGPYVILAAVAIVAFWRHRSIGTALLALGFLAYVAAQIASSFVSADISRTYNSHGQVTSVISNFHGWAWTLSRYAGTVGMWIAALGAVFQALRGARRIDAA